MTIDRKTYVGSGDIPAIVGVSPYRSALDVWAQKTGLAEDQGLNPAMRVGIALERPILEALYAEPRGIKLDYPGTLIGLDGKLWIGATPDALVANDPAFHGFGKSLGGVECKVVGSRQASRWGDEQEGAEGVPAEVLVQVQWQMIVTGRSLWDVAALLGGTDFRVYRVEHDTTLATDLLRAAERFWHEHVVARVAPEITDANAANARELLARLYPRQTSEELREMTPDVRALAEHYIAARALVTDAESQRDAAAAKLQAAIGDLPGFSAPDLKVTWKAGDSGSVRWKEVASGYRATLAKLGVLASDLDAAESLATSAPTRRLDVREITRRK